VATFLKFRIAQRQGIAANLQFRYLEQEFLAGLAGEAADGAKLLQRGQVQSLVLSFLAGEAFDNPALAPVRQYVGNETASVQERELRRFQLAAQLALVFEEYAYTRPDMLRSWQFSDAAAHDSEVAGFEAWQAVIWRRLFGAGGRLDGLSAAGAARYVHFA